PTAFVILDALPLSTNGKIDRAALPEPAQPAGAARAAMPVDGPQAALVARVASLVAAVVNVENIAPDANLLTIWASSIDLVRVVNALEQQFGFRPDLNYVFQQPTVAALAAYCAERASQPVATSGVDAVEPEEGEWEEGDV